MHAQQRIRFDVVALAASAMTMLLAACGGGGGGYGGGSSGASSGGCGGLYEPACPPMNSGAPSVTLNALPSTVNRSVTLTATPTAPNGVSRVDFLVDNQVIGSASASPYTTTWNTGTFSDGAHSVIAQVRDAQNQTANSASASVTVANTINVDVVLVPSEEYPTPSSTAQGSGRLTASLVTGAISGSFTLSGMTATMAHIHDAYAGNTGPILIGFAPHASIANRWDLPANATLTTAQIDRLLAGALYVNAHSSAYPAGEVRAQIKPSGIRVAFASMSGANEAPPVSIAASGVAAVTVDANTREATAHFNSTGVADANMAHVHRGASGANGPILITLASDPARVGHWFVEKQSVTANDIADFNAGLWYANMHTPAFATGAIRGQFPAAPATLTQLQSAIFGPRCASCHTGGGSSLPTSMNLSSAASTYAALVGVASVEVPSLQRVAANNVSGSYLINKIEGTQSVGGRMPLNGPPYLTQAEIDSVKSWIAAGALNN